MTESQSSGFVQAGGTSVSAAASAASALGSRSSRTPRKFLCAASLLRSPVPVKEGTA